METKKFEQGDDSTGCNTNAVIVEPPVLPSLYEEAIKTRKYETTDTDCFTKAATDAQNSQEEGRLADKDDEPPSYEEAIEQFISNIYVCEMIAVLDVPYFMKRFIDAQNSKEEKRPADKEDEPPSYEKTTNLRKSVLHDTMTFVGNESAKCSKRKALPKGCNTTATFDVQNTQEEERIADNDDAPPSYEETFVITETKDETILGEKSAALSKGYSISSVDVQNTQEEERIADNDGSTLFISEFKYAVRGEKQQNDPPSYEEAIETKKYELGDGATFEENVTAAVVKKHTSAAIQRHVVRFPTTGCYSIAVDDDPPSYEEVMETKKCEIGDGATDHNGGIKNARVLIYVHQFTYKAEKRCISSAIISAQNTQEEQEVADNDGSTLFMTY